jgi:hypothetical protein
MHRSKCIEILPLGAFRLSARLLAYDPGWENPFAEFCWRIGLRIEFLDTDRREHVNQRSFRSLFPHPLRSTAERPSEH